MTYTYDVVGDRVQQAKWQPSPGTVTTRFDYDGQNVWADTDTSNNLQVRYLRGDVVDQIFARSEASGQANPGVAWYLTDRLASVRDLMDSTQTLRDHLDYDGFGNATESNATFGDRYKYTGREYDATTGLQYNRARYYDPHVGRWMSEDPLGFSPGDGNLYRYVLGDPLGSTDPLGLAAIPAHPPDSYPQDLLDAEPWLEPFDENNPDWTGPVPEKGGNPPDWVSPKGRPYHWDKDHWDIKRPGHNKGKIRVDANGGLYEHPPQRGQDEGAQVQWQLPGEWGQIIPWIEGALDPGQPSWHDGDPPYSLGSRPSGGLGGVYIVPGLPSPGMGGAPVIEPVPGLGGLLPVFP